MNLFGKQETKNPKNPVSQNEIFCENPISLKEVFFSSYLSLTFFQKILNRLFGTESRFPSLCSPDFCRFANPFSLDKQGLLRVVPFLSELYDFIFFPVFLLFSFHFRSMCFSAFSLKLFSGSASTPAFQNQRNIPNGKSGKSGEIETDREVSRSYREIGKPKKLICLKNLKILGNCADRLLHGRKITIPAAYFFEYKKQ